MKYILIAIALLFGLSSNLNAQQLVLPEFNKIQTLDSEVGDAIIHLEDNVSEEDRPYTKFFTTYTIRGDSPQKTETLRQHAVLTTSFICHSMIGVNTGKFVGGGYYPLAKYDTNPQTKEVSFNPINRVPGSKTLWWIDIRNFNWTEQAWESMMTTQGYVVEPIVTHEKNSALRLLSGNSLVRMDWFITHSSAITNQADTGSKIAIYKDFLYGTLTARPKTVTEFEKVWGIDTIKARENGNVSSTLVTESKAVARHNRILFGYRTENGWYYRSYDVNHQQGVRNYGDNILNFKGEPPPKGAYDGGEIFATNFLRMQAYDLYNAQESTEVAFGDPTLVRHMTDVLGDPRVRTPHSCYDCHAGGPIPSENSLREFLAKRADAKVYDKYDYLRLKRTVLDGRFEDQVDADQLEYAKSLLKINGLKPEENVRYYLEITGWYNKGVTLEQAAYECGVTPEQFKASMEDENKVKPYKVPFNIGRLLANGAPIPRDIWESPGRDGQPGIFQQAMIIIHGLTIITDTETVENVITIYKDTPIYAADAKTVVGNLKAGFKIKEAKEAKANNGWIGVKLISGGFGYIKK